MSNRKKLLIVRHAKSSWDYDDIADIDRPLKSKGILKAYQISHKLKHENLVPDLIISSPANRALHTAIIFMRVLEVSLQQLFVSQLLYDASTSQIVELVRHTSDDISSLMIFGHNPDFTSIVNHFAKNPIGNLPTSGAVTFVFETKNWKNVSKKMVDRQINFFPDKNNLFWDQKDR